MGLAEDLKVLEELHQRGKLTDQEFADAKAKTLQKSDQSAVNPAKKRGWHPLTLVIALLLLLVIPYWYSHGTRDASRMLTTAVHAPTTVTDEIVNVPANSWKTVNFTLPYGAKLEFNIRVIRGNPIDVMVAAQDQLDAMQKGQWGSVRVYTDFNAAKTTTYRRTGQLPPGSYYLVLRDTSLGILSQPASDVSVKVQLNP